MGNLAQPHDTCICFKVNNRKIKELEIIIYLITSEKNTTVWSFFMTSFQSKMISNLNGYFECQNNKKDLKILMPR